MKGDKTDENSEGTVAKEGEEKHDGEEDANEEEEEEEEEKAVASGENGSEASDGDSGEEDEFSSADEAVLTKAGRQSGMEVQMCACSFTFVCLFWFVLMHYGWINLTKRPPFPWDL